MFTVPQERTFNGIGELWERGMRTKRLRSSTRMEEDFLQNKGRSLKEELARKRLGLENPKICTGEVSRLQEIQDRVTSRASSERAALEAHLWCT